MSIEIFYLARQLLGFHAPRGLVCRWDIFAHFFKRLCSSYAMHLVLHMGFPVGSMTICTLWSWRDWMTRLMVIAENNSITQVASPPSISPSVLSSPMVLCITTSRASADMWLVVLPCARCVRVALIDWCYSDWASHSIPYSGMKHILM